ncbi:TIGR03899 family protein [Alteromonas flava]|uniref:TIGR03899 family protein n=1 Tax=Alteromonas flava TaxID=2048003 RepID=UPI000C291B3B|nr:TIGR03899 family protein [Alteromonas flava]
MKIEDSTSIQAKPVSAGPKTAKISRPSKSTPSKPEASNSTKSERQQRSADTIRRWFAQIGVEESSGLDSNIDWIRQTHRREQLLAQQRLTNLQRVLEHAVSVNIESDHTDNLDPDWFFSFSRFAEDIHAPGMQTLWGKIIAVEVARPGSFSIQTLALLKQLTQKDARLFSKAASIASRRRHDSVPRLLVGYHQKPSVFTWFAASRSKHLNLAQHGITYPDLLALIDMGLLFSSEIETGELDPAKGEHWRCGDEQFELSPKKSGTALVYYKFTRIGSELYRLISRQPRADYCSDLFALLEHAFQITKL